MGMRTLLMQEVIGMRYYAAPNWCIFNNSAYPGAICLAAFSRLEPEARAPDLTTYKSVRDQRAESE